MKVEFFDLALDDREKFKKFVEDHQVIDIKLSAGSDALVMYEEHEND